MTQRRVSAVGWVARILGILFVLLMANGWLDEVQARGGQGTWVEQWAVTTHLVPLVALIVVVVLGWRWPLIGAIGFLGYAAVTVFSYVPEWGYAPLVTGPPALIGVLYGVDWLLSRRKVIATA